MGTWRPKWCAFTDGGTSPARSSPSQTSTPVSDPSVTREYRDSYLSHGFFAHYILVRKTRLQPPLHTSLNKRTPPCVHICLSFRTWKVILGASAVRRSAGSYLNGFLAASRGGWQRWRTLKNSVWKQSANEKYSQQGIQSSANKPHRAALPI